MDVPLKFPVILFYLYGPWKYIAGLMTCFSNMSVLTKVFSPEQVEPSCIQAVGVSTDSLESKFFYPQDLFLAVLSNTSMQYSCLVDQA